MRTLLAHRGICVSDLEAACSFYVGALGFRPFADGVADAFVLRHLMGRTNAQIQTQFLRDQSGVTIELMQFTRPESRGERRRRPLNQFGLTHFCFWTPDIEERAGLIEKYGGEPHWQTLVAAREMDTRVMYCSDPDGVRIEIGERRDEPLAFLHSGICVGDVAATIAFYGSVLNFREIECIVMERHSEWLSPLMELPDVTLAAHVLVGERDQRIEVLECYRPAPFASRERAAPNRFGLSHMTFTVTDLAQTAALVSRAGGAVEHIQVAHEGSRALVFTDSNGVVIIFVEAGR